MTMLPTADQLIEDVYDYVFRTCPEEHRVDVARTAKLAVEYRLHQIKQQRMAKAIEARKITGDQQQRAADVPFGRDGAH